MKIIVLVVLNFLLGTNSFSQKSIYYYKINGSFPEEALILLNDTGNAIWFDYLDGWVMWSNLIYYEINEDTLILNPAHLKDRRLSGDVLLLKRNSLVSLELQPKIYYKKRKIPKRIRNLLDEYPPPLVLTINQKEVHYSILIFFLKLSYFDLKIFRVSNNIYPYVFRPF